VLGPGGEAEDAAQEALVRAWRRRESCRTPEEPDGWVAVIARREAIRLASRRREAPVGEVPDTAGEPPGEPDPLDVLRVAIDAMAPQDRGLLVGRYVLDLSHRELARRSGLNEGTVRVRLHRLRSRLRVRAMET
jgi:RNA polymerase sigma-70 factor (ECF subfamily)